MIRFATAAAIAPLVLAFAAPALAQPVLSPGYKVPRSLDGHADISGNWSNATLTPEQRPASQGDRAVMNAQEIAKAEGEIVKEIEEGNRPTDPNKGAFKVGGELPAADSAFNKPQYIAAGGAVGGYDRGWLDTGDRVMRVHGEARTSIITTPNGRPPARKAGAPVPQRPAGMGNPVDNPESRSLGDRCIISFGRNGGPPMLANGFYNNNYQILQTKDAVIINIEMVHDSRIVRIGGTHRADNVRPYFGDSIGHWEGDTLVVETTNIPQSQAYYGAWENLKVTERFTRVGPNRLHYAYKVEDPTVWDTAWGGEYEFAPLNGDLHEYACHEGNYAMEDILAGARQEERDAAAKVAAAKN
ncbi:MAG TPA: hypothetical protein VFN88_05630 [Caulobacteraceae bacterium]|nr:hypothetical protein [Caulobacteraceae bacterium]